MDDIHDADEDIKHSNEESKEDHGSVHVPSKIPIEVRVKVLDDDKELMEATPKDDCDFLELLPRELRDKVCTP